jgi:hypothetical protein
MGELFSSRRYLRAARLAVAALVLGMATVSLAGIALFPSYAATHANAFTPNDAWTAAEVEAGLADLGWPAGAVAWMELARDVVFLVVNGTLALLLLRRRADSWFVLYVALVFAVMTGARGPMLAVGELVPAVGRLETIIGAVGWQLFFILFLFFPDGRPAPGWARWIGYGWAGYVLYQVTWYALSNDGPDAASVNPVEGALFTGVVIVAIGSQVYRYLHRSDVVQRQQTKWVVFTLAVGLAVIVLSVTLGFQQPNHARIGRDLAVALFLWALFNLVFAIVPAAIGIAILRYRLWDIDVIIRRTLAYAIVSATLAAFYLFSVVGLQALFVRLTGQESTLAVVGATLAAAALFQPLRGAVQRQIDRRFFRTRYDARMVLEAFADRAQRSTELDVLAADLLATVDETLKPERGRLWLTRSDEAPR